MKTVTITFKADVDDNGVEELKRCVDHHIEGLLDLNSWPEIQTVYNANLKEDAMHEIQNE